MERLRLSLKYGNEGDVIFPLIARAALSRCGAKKAIAYLQPSTFDVLQVQDLPQRKLCRKRQPKKGR